MSDRTRDDLETLRAGLLESFASASVAVKAQIAGQLRAVIQDLAALGEPVEKVSKADEITARRKAREGDAADRSLADGRGQRRRSQGRNRAS